MSEPHSPVSTPADGPEGRSPKRLRLESDYEHTPQYSSADDGGGDCTNDPELGPVNGTSLGEANGPESDEGEDSHRTESDHQDDMDHTVYRDQRGRRRGSSSAVRHLKTPPPPSRQWAKLQYQPTLILRGHKKGVSAVKFSPDGRLIASCSADATIKIWDAISGKHIQTLEGHLAGISTIAWSPDSKTLASGSDDKSIRLWDVPTGKAYPVPLLGHHNYIYSIAFSPNGNMIVSGSYDEAVFIWDVRTARVMRSLPAHSDPVGGVDFVRDGTLVVSCAGDGLIRVWDTATGQCLRTLVHEDNAGVTSVRFSPNGRFVLAWTLDSCVRLWNYVDGRCVKTYQGHRNERYSLGGTFGIVPATKRARNRDDRRDEARDEARDGAGSDTTATIISGSEDGALMVWEVKDKTVLQRIEHAHDAGSVVLGVDFLPLALSPGSAKDSSVDGTLDGDLDGRAVLASCGTDCTVRLWREHDVSEEQEEREEELRIEEPGEVDMETDADADADMNVEVEVEEPGHGDE